uniref:Uncharacterized protein n=1 Tax=Panagrolaimus sp. ES5 TaxID=591445 RepID=A0AC34FZC7_9BILA
MVDNTDTEFRIPIDIRDLTLIFKMLKESNPYSGKLNYIYVCEILHRIAEANKQPGSAETYLDFTKLSNIENEFKKAMIHIQKGGQPSQPTTTVTTTTIKNANPDSGAVQKDGSAKAAKTKGFSREAATAKKKCDAKGKGKSAENSKKKKKELKEDAKRQSKEAIGKKGKTKLKSAEPLKHEQQKKKKEKPVESEKEREKIKSK